MRLSEIQRSDYDIENDLADDAEYGKILVAEFKKKYPKVKITLNSNILETADGEFYFQADPAVDNGYYGILMGDVKSGKYKGVVANIIVAITKWIKPHAPKGYKPALFIDDDESGGVWDIIAKKLKLKIIVISEDDDFGNLGTNATSDAEEYDWESAGDIPPPGTHLPSAALRIAELNKINLDEIDPSTMKPYKGNRIDSQIAFYKHTKNKKSGFWDPDYSQKTSTKGWNSAFGKWDDLYVDVSEL